MLVQAGFSVERFNPVFPDPLTKREQGVKDPKVIAHCNSKGYILLTSDAAIVTRHRLEIERAKHLGIIATAHNTVESITVWVEAFIKLKPLLQQNSFRKRQRPWFVKFNKRGEFTSAVRYISPSDPRTARHSHREAHPAGASK